MYSILKSKFLDSLKQVRREGLLHTGTQHLKCQKPEFRRCYAYAKRSYSLLPEPSSAENAYTTKLNTIIVKIIAP